VVLMMQADDSVKKWRERGVVVFFNAKILRTTDRLLKSGVFQM